MPETNLCKNKASVIIKYLDERINHTDMPPYVAIDCKFTIYELYLIRDLLCNYRDQKRK
jgi:hypothetical protein